MHSGSITDLLDVLVAYSSDIRVDFPAKRKKIPEQLKNSSLTPVSIIKISSIIPVSIMSG
jgi:hypothetical protein